MNFLPAIIVSALLVATIFFGVQMIDDSRENSFDCKDMGYDGYRLMNEHWGCYKEMDYEPQSNIPRYCTAAKDSGLRAEDWCVE